MNAPVPVFGRGGWVCAALLVGLFAGGGITWSVLARRGVRQTLVIYQLPADKGSPPARGPACDNLPRRGEVVEPVALERDLPATGSSPGQPEVRLRHDRIVRGHPQAEGCFTNALAAMDPFTKQGFDLRDTVWDGEISLDEAKSVSCQLFKGNDYCFCVGTDAKGAKLSLQLYDRDGQPTEAEQAAQSLPAGASATARMRCPQTGTYFVIVKLEAATQDKVPWGMVSAYR